MSVMITKVKIITFRKTKCIEMIKNKRGEMRELKPHHKLHLRSMMNLNKSVRETKDRVISNNQEEHSREEIA